MLYEINGIAPKTPENLDFWVAPNASVVGNIIIQSGVGIWFGATLRGDNEQILIGEFSNIQENCTLHTDIGFPLTIGKNCTVGHGAIIHGCCIGDNTLIGMGAIILNDAKIGHNCLIGAGALVKEGTVIPDGSLVVGTPAKVIRNLTDEQIGQITRSAKNYYKNMQTFRDDLHPVKQEC